MKPALDRSTVLGKRRAENRAMIAHAPFVRSARSDDDPLPDLPRLPAERSTDDCGKAAPTVRHAKQLVDIHELGLELDQQQRLRWRVPRHQIDDPALAEVVEGHLRSHFSGDGDELSGDRLAHRSVAGRHDAVPGGAAPPRVERDPHLEDGADPADCREFPVVQLPALEA
jgi:hypothetical protein